jgi:hypothetical protein
MTVKHLGAAKPNSRMFKRGYTVNLTPKVPFTKPDPAMVKVVLRTLRDQLKARHEVKQSKKEKPHG